MIVVADTTPINYLILIGEIGMLPKLYGRVIIPSTVVHELTHPLAPEMVRLWMTARPAWLEVYAGVLPANYTIQGLDAGESEAIAIVEMLARSADSVQLIIDEALGRQEAQRRGLLFIGTIGVLREAARRGFLDLRGAIERLQQTTFHISPSILAAILQA